MREGMMFVNDVDSVFNLNQLAKCRFYLSVCRANEYIKNKKYETVYGFN